MGDDRGLLRDEAELIKADLRRFLRDMKIAMVVQTIVIIGATVDLLKLLP